MKDIVSFKGARDGIKIIFDKDIDFNMLCDFLITKIQSSGKFFDNCKSDIIFEGRIFTDIEEEKVVNIIDTLTTMEILSLKILDLDGNLIKNKYKLKNNVKDNDIKDNLVEDINVEIAIGVGVSEALCSKKLDAMDINTEKGKFKEKNKKELDLSNNSISIEDLMEALEDPEVCLTKIHKGSLRGGQVLKFDGSVVIFGGVNAGAEVKATGSIIVLGQLKGIAHAGCNGDEKAFVSALYLDPVQIRIGKTVTAFPSRSKDEIGSAEYAYLDNGNPCVRPL